MSENINCAYIYPGMTKVGDIVSVFRYPEGMGICITFLKHTNLTILDYSIVINYIIID